MLPTKSESWRATEASCPDVCRVEAELASVSFAARATSAIAALTCSTAVDCCFAGGAWAHAGATPGDPGQHDTPAAAYPHDAAVCYAGGRLQGLSVGLDYKL